MTAKVELTESDKKIKSHKRTPKELNFVVFPETYLPRVSQWFVSLEGEGEQIGETSLYVRVAGCYSAACTFCDTKFSWFDKKKFPIYTEASLKREMLEKELNKERVIERMTLTGGEPLHYMKNFKNMAEYFNELNNSNLKWFGVESNGNILHKIENILELIKQFNSIKKLGIEPMLTISPKLDSKTCYQEELTEKDIEVMYTEVFENIYNYMANFNINYKFIWNHNLPNNLELKFIDDLIYKFKVDRNKIFLMPFTPYDAYGENAVEWEHSKYDTSRKALELGVRYSPRLQIDLHLD